MDLRTEKVRIETDRYRIDGLITLPSEGFRSRLSDFVNQRDRDFFAIQDARLTELDGERSTDDVDFVMVAKQHVRVITPLEDNGTARPA
jgi:hypothetical protein